MRRFLHNVKYFLRYYGVSRAIAIVLPKLAPSLRQSDRLINWKESAFDRKFGIRTVGNVEVADLDISSEAKKNAVEYCPTSGIALGVILEELEIDHTDYTFVDFGCGKGRVLCLAAEFPFREIIGVEISDTLRNAADENISRMSAKRKICQRMRAVNADATAFGFPITPLVLYFFNPFGNTIMARVLDNARESWNTTRRNIFIVYSNPRHQHILDSSDFWRAATLRSGPVHDGWAVYRTPAA